MHLCRFPGFERIYSFSPIDGSHVDGVPPFQTRDSWSRPVFTPDGRHVICGSYSGKIHIWEVASGRLARTLSAHGGPVSSLDISYDGTRIASGGIDEFLMYYCDEKIIEEESKPSSS
jgi:WD40 repeat protein